MTKDEEDLFQAIFAVINATAGDAEGNLNPSQYPAIHQQVLAVEAMAKRMDIKLTELTHPEGFTNFAHVLKLIKFRTSSGSGKTWE